MVVLDDMRALNGAPDRSLEQRLEALTKANWTRSERARLKVDVKAGRVWVGALLADPPDWLLAMKTFDLLLAIPTVGRVKALKWLKVAGVSPSKTVGGLSSRQRAELRRFL